MRLLLSGIMLDLWGRRRIVQIAVSCTCIGWLLIAVSTTYPLMLVGRTLCGFGKGGSFPGIIVSKKQRNTRNMVKMWRQVTMKQELARARTYEHLLPPWSSILLRQRVLSWSITFSYFMEVKDSSTRLRQPATWHYLEPDKPSPCLHPPSWRSILILYSHLRLGLPSGSFPQIFPPKSCMHLLSSPSHSSRIDNRNNARWGVQIIKLLII